MDGLVDNVKRGRLFGVAVISTLVVLVTQLTDTSNTPFWMIFLRAGGYALFIYIVLIWGLRFQVTLYSLLFVLPYTAIYLLLQYVFFEIFFLTLSGRVMEILILIILGLLIFVGNYASILMANSFNVGTIKDIPLIHAARTISYILLLLQTYFLTYSLLHSGVNIFSLIPIFFVFIFISLYLHLKNSDLQDIMIIKYVLAITFVVILSLFSILFVNIEHAIGALAPTVVVYALIGTIMNNSKQLLTNKDTFIYLLSLIIVYLIIFFFRVM